VLEGVTGMDVTAQDVACIPARIPDGWHSSYSRNSAVPPLASWPRFPKKKGFWPISSFLLPDSATFDSHRAYRRGVSDKRRTSQGDVYENSRCVCQFRIRPQ
jgi:hypothetical protein